MWLEVMNNVQQMCILEKCLSKNLIICCFLAVEYTKSKSETFHMSETFHIIIPIIQISHFGAIMDIKDKKIQWNYPVYLVLSKKLTLIYELNKHVSEGGCWKMPLRLGNFTCLLYPFVSIWVKRMAMDTKLCKLGLK